jgi:hypothetical protein
MRTTTTKQPTKMVNKKQQTAVEWLEQEMLKPNLSMKEILEKAKEVEKERTINFAEDWYFNGSVMMKKIDVKSTIEKHFNNTYGGGNK